MTVDLSNPHLKAVLERAGMPAPSRHVLAQLDAACAGVEGHTNAVLDISQAQWATETDGEDVLVVLMRKIIILVAMHKRGLFKEPEPSPRTLVLADYQDVAEDDEFAGPTVWFLAREEDKQFLLKWSSTEERHRMFMAMFDAHRGNYARWGLQLDPANYAADFDRYYAQIVAEGPSQSSDVYDWVQEQFGEFYLSNALGLAMDWRMCELDDAERHGSSRRVGRIAFPIPWADEGPEAQRVVVGLGEQLFDEGLLGPPYDERTFDTGEPISHGDAGPARLIALMSLAGYARTLDNPRAAEWIEAARMGISVVPPKVFSENLRQLWSKIEDLPAVDDGPPPEIPIWEDVDVRAISTMQGDPPRPVYAMEGLAEADAELVRMFFGADQSLKAADLPDGDSVTKVCLLGVRAFEGLSSDVPLGWRKLILYAVSDLTYSLWEKYEIAEPAAKLAHWIVATIEANHWGPDGRTTPLGQHHSYAMGVAVRSGLGTIQIDPATGLASAPTGDEARNAASAGHF